MSNRAFKNYVKEPRQHKFKTIDTASYKKENIAQTCTSRDDPKIHVFPISKLGYAIFPVLS
jgi:hypothetical protein